VLAVACNASEERRLKLLTARMATYLQAPAYGELLFAINGWDPALLERFRTSPQVQEVRGSIDAVATPSQLEGIAEVIPAEWLAASAVGSPEHVASRIEDQLKAGADGVILHASTPAQLETTLAAYRKTRPADRYAGRSTNPGR
jgi:alkanesulfonate monooxygenase SsuD/methylene tetrahydromethanopterin reductase-like flavin-dependent oxidoreductase (luciferase family)